MRADQAARGGQVAFQQTGHEAFSGVALIATAEQAHAAVDQQRAEHVDDPFETREQLGSGGDEGAAQHESAEDAVEEHPVLVGGRDGVGAEDQRPDEDVVER